MKKNLIMICFLTSISNVFGQTKSKLNTHSPNNDLSYKQWINHLMQPVIALRKKNAEKVTETKERLIAQSEYTHSVTISLDTQIVIDSSSYVYSSDRSSYFNYNYMTYYNNYVIDGSQIFEFGSSIGFFDRNDNPSTLSDTTYIFTLNYFTDSLNIMDIRSAAYDTFNNILLYSDNYPGSFSTLKNINVFDTNRNIVSSLSSNYNSFTSTYDTMYLRLFSFDVNSRLFEDSTSIYNMGTWTLFEKWQYSYDDSGNMVQASYSLYDPTTYTWNEQKKYLMTYYLDNKIKTVGLYVDSSYGLVSVNIDTFGYTTGINYFTYCKEFAYLDSGKLFSIRVSTKYVDTAGLPDTLFTANYDQNDSLLNKYCTVFQYDTYEEPLFGKRYLSHFDTIALAYVYDTFASVIDYYYYEPYTLLSSHHSSVINTPPPCTTVNIFPNPAQQAVNVQITGINKGANIQLTLLNVAGQKIITESLPWLQETERFSIAGLPTGVYWLLVQDKAGNTLGKQQLVKE